MSMKTAAPAAISMCSERIDYWVSDLMVCQDIIFGRAAQLARQEPIVNI